MRQTLERWSADELTEVTVLLACELVTNGILHARTPLHLRLVGDEARVRVELCDESPVVPFPSSYDENAQTGRGLTLVESLANRWGVERHEDGKVVWFEMPR